MEKSKTRIRRALISVSDKDGIVDLCKTLEDYGVEIISTGGTAATLKSSGIDVIPIEKITGNPEAFSGRMKTISFNIESALLFKRYSENDQQEAKDLSIQPIDLVVCNLYPFEQVAAKKGCEDDLIENIDIGGPTMIRAAAKNYEGVTVCCSPADYPELIAELKQDHGRINFDLRRRYALKAFQLTANYDQAIFKELVEKFDEPTLNLQKSLDLRSRKDLRYGENPHQKASFYLHNNSQSDCSVATAKIVQGKQLSYNNLLDADAAWKSMSDVFNLVKSSKEREVVSIVKHLNPCGLASSGSQLQSLKFAWAGDPMSAFGSIICFSSEVSAEAALWLKDKFIEVIIAPHLSEEAQEIFSKKKNMRVLLCSPKKEFSKEEVIRSICGGILVQEEDELQDNEFQLVTRSKFDNSKMSLAKFGILAGKHLKSNAIALVSLIDPVKGKGFWLTGAGMGQPNRLDSLRSLAIPRFDQKENCTLKDAILISDAFFPFSDNIEEANKFGIKYVVQPGGSIRDKEVIDCCDRYNMAMIFTGRRHFRH